MHKIQIQRYISLILMERRSSQLYHYFPFLPKLVIHTHFYIIEIMMQCFPMKIKILHMLHFSTIQQLLYIFLLKNGKKGRNLPQLWFRLRQWLKSPYRFRRSLTPVRCRSNKLPLICRQNLSKNPIRLTKHGLMHYSILFHIYR